ncbi:hypothetical protein C8Q74DRAFT_402751 [Fomes fomentarius]|nr:hypothetical protein C8Q74DRAFT_402751 [Fomes fomentarius]
MNDSRLPVEICEHIIDFERPWAGILRGKKFWCSTTLVCSAWLPRSRFNLYRKVTLKNSGQARLLLRTLEENSHLAHLVVKLELRCREYMPLAQLARLLKNCVILHFVDVYWENLPPYVADACLYSLSLLGIVKLSLSVQRSTARALLRFIHSLAKLEDLTIQQYYEKLGDMGPIRALGPRRSQNGTPTALSKLKKLQLRVRTFSKMLDSDPDGSHRATLYASNIRQITSEMLWCTYMQRSMTVRSHVCATAIQIWSSTHRV